MFIVVTNAEVQRDVLLQEQACQMDGRKVQYGEVIYALVVQQNEKRKKLSEKRSHGIIHQQGKKSIKDVVA